MVLESTITGSADGFKQITGMVMKPAFLKTLVAVVLKVNPAPDGSITTTELLGASNWTLLGDGADRSTANCRLVTSKLLERVNEIPPNVWPGVKVNVPLLLA